MPLTDVRVFDAGDRECAPGEIGEIRMRGPLVMKGYWRNPEATAQAIRDGWLCSGDLGRADAQGNFFLDRTSVVSGKSVSVRVGLGGRRIIKKKKNKYNQRKTN